MYQRVYQRVSVFEIANLWHLCIFRVRRPLERMPISSLKTTKTLEISVAYLLQVSSLLETYLGTNLRTISQYLKVNLLPQHRQIFPL